MTAASQTRRYLNAKASGRFSQLPEWLETCPDVSPLAKLIYARLLRYASDKDGRGWIAFPSQQQLCKALGLVDDAGEPRDRVLREYLSELVTFGLLESVRAGLGRSNYYRFPVHPLMYAEGEDATSETPPEPPADGAQVADSDRRGTSGQDRKNSAGQDRKNSAGQDRRESSAPDRRPFSAPDRKDSAGPVGTDPENRSREQNYFSFEGKNEGAGPGSSNQKVPEGVTAFVEWVMSGADPCGETGGFRLQSPGKIPERIAEGFSAYDCILALYQAARSYDQEYVNAVVPFKPDNFGALLDQARAEFRRAEAAAHRLDEEREHGREEAITRARKRCGLTEDGRHWLLAHFADHGCHPEKRQAVAS